MKKLTVQFLAAVTFATLIAGPLASHPLPDTSPHDSSRAIAQLDVSAYQVELVEGDSIDFAKHEIKKVSVDEARFVDVRIEEDRLVLVGSKPGKAVVRLLWTNKDIEMDHEAKHGIGMFVTTLIVNVKGEEE